MTSDRFPVGRGFVLVASVLLALAGCGKHDVAVGINDPYEAHNRAVHETNKNIDRNILRPLSRLGGDGEPGVVMRSAGNFSGNLSLPKSFVNDVLQANVDDAAHNFTRFLINSTFGIAGLFDPATAWGLAERNSDFGETLHVWGFAEGHYVELPLLGPSTKRDAIGKVVDLFTNPLSYVLPTPERYGIPVAGAVSKFGDRGQNGETIDAILYDSADSYTQLRLLYLENRRFNLSGEQTQELADDYDDYYAQ